MTIRFRTTAVVFAVLFVLGWQPLPEALLRQFEDVYVVPTKAFTDFAGVVVLGGAVHSGRIWHSRGQIQLTEAAERMTHAVILLRQYPHLKLVYTGTEGRRGADAAGVMAGAPQAARFFEAMGVDRARLVLEAVAANTHENATFTAALPSLDIHRPWLLLTSAAHMPRAMAAFRKAGWNVTPYPVDYQTAVETSWLKFSLVKGLIKWQNVAYETLGWMEYRLRGWV